MVKMALFYHFMMVKMAYNEGKNGIVEYPQINNNRSNAIRNGCFTTPAAYVSVVARSLGARAHPDVMAMKWSSAKALVDFYCHESIWKICPKSSIARTRDGMNSI